MKTEQEIRPLPFVINTVSCILLISAIFGISNAISTKNIFSVPVSLVNIFLAYNLFLGKNWARNWIVLFNKILIGIASVALILFLLSIPFFALSKLIDYFLPNLNDHLENNQISTVAINALALVYTGIIQPLTLILLLKDRGSISKAFFLGILINILIPFSVLGYFSLKPKNYFVFENKAVPLEQIADEVGKYYFSSEVLNYSISTPLNWKLIKDKKFIDVYASSMDDFRKEINYEVLLINPEEGVLSPINFRNLPEDFSLDQCSKIYAGSAPKDFVFMKKAEFLINDNTIYQMLFKSDKDQSYVLHNVIWKHEFGGLEITVFADKKEQLERIMGGLDEIFKTVNIY